MGILCNSHHGPFEFFAATELSVLTFVQGQLNLIHGEVNATMLPALDVNKLK